MNYFSDSSRISAAIPPLKPEHQSHLDPKMSNETTVAIPLRAYPISKEWTECSEQSRDIGQPELFEHNQWAEGESQQTQRIMLGL